MEQNEELQRAWEFAEHTHTSIFLTGKAGTGKTTFLRNLQQHSSKSIVVVAPTGAAAINAGGVTIHSFFQLPLSPYIPGIEIRDKFSFSRDKLRIIRMLDLLVIDEISMVRSDLLDAIDNALRKYRRDSRPFGGVQLMMIGDLQQLSPIMTPQDEELLAPHYPTPTFSAAVHCNRLITSPSSSQKYTDSRTSHLSICSITYVPEISDVKTSVFSTRDTSRNSSRHRVLDIYASQHTIPLPTAITMIVSRALPHRR